LARSRTTTTKWPPLLVVGLTGGIASGKSTVARMLAELGATVISADAEGRAVAAPGEPALAEIAAEFGPGFLAADGSLDRKALGRRVFENPRDLETLNRITHPRIRARLERRLRELAKQPPNPPVVVVEAAILVEAGWHSAVDRVVVVAVQPSTQEHRLIAGFGYEAVEARARVRSQMPAERRLRYADYTLNGELPLPTLRSEAAVLWRELCRISARPLHK
jgi:dephospho-CoA kinase